MKNTSGYFGFVKEPYNAYLLEGAKHGKFTIALNDFAKPLGVGTFGRVYLALNKSSQPECSVAIKVINRHKALPDGVIREELEIMTKIGEQTLKGSYISNIIYAIDYFIEQDYVYIVMPKCDGDFEEIIRQWVAEKKDDKSTETKLIRDECEVFEYFRQICYGTRILHVMDYLHRDLKFGNILFQKVGEGADYKYGLSLVLTDMGLTKENNSNGNTVNVGTYETMAPEVKISSNYGIKADLYSLGCMLFKMLTSKYPCEFNGDGNYYPDFLNLKGYNACKLTLFVLEGCLQRSVESRIHPMYLYKLLDVENIYLQYSEMHSYPFNMTDEDTIIRLDRFTRRKMFTNEKQKIKPSNMFTKFIDLDPAMDPK